MPDKAENARGAPRRVAPYFWRRYGDATKRANRAALDEQLASGAPVVSAYPWRIVLEPSSRCNLHCCDGQNGEGLLPKGALSIEAAGRFLRELWPYLVQVNLFNWGEPFLNPALPEITAMIHGRGVGTHVHSNFHLVTKNFSERIIRAGLDFLVASIDGADQRSYGAYRLGGDFTKVIANLETFLEVRAKLGSPTPRVIWRFLVFRHNEHEAQRAEELARRIGVDDFVLGMGRSDAEIWLPDKGFVPLAEDRHAGAPHCRDLWTLPVIHWDGSLLPCCHVSTTDYVYGNAADGFLPAFNSEAFRDSRTLLAGREAAPTPCARCHRAPKDGARAQETLRA